MPSLTRLAAAAAFVLVPGAALAHPGHGEGFVHGFVHPVGGWDHVLAMVAVGLYAALLGGRALWAVPASFVGMMAVGGALGMAGVNMPYTEAGIMASIVVLGLAVALRIPLPTLAAMALRRRVRDLPRPRARRRNAGRRLGPHVCGGLPARDRAAARGGRGGGTDRRPPRRLHADGARGKGRALAALTSRPRSELRSMPSPSISTSQTSPAFIQIGFGLRAWPTPDGVPVKMMSPGSRRHALRDVRRAFPSPGTSCWRCCRSA